MVVVDVELEVDVVEDDVLVVEVEVLVVDVDVEVDELVEVVVPAGKAQTYPPDISAISSGFNPLGNR